MAIQQTAGTHRAIHVPGLSQPLSIVLGAVVALVLLTVLSALMWYSVFNFTSGQSIALALALSLYLALMIGVMALIGFGVTHDHNL